MSAISTVVEIIQKIEAQCGDRPKKLVVPDKLWVMAYSELLKIKIETSDISPMGSFDRFYIHGVEVRIE